jgi:hypothetical protein
MTPPPPRRAPCFASLPGSKIHEGVKGVRAMFVRFGIELTPARNGSTASLAYDGHRENMPFNATDAAKRYLKADAHHWNMGSGGTHSKAWFLPSVLDGLTDEKLSSEVEQFGAPTFAVLASARVLLTAVAAHSGVSTTPAREAVFMREKALMAFVQGNDPSPISLAEFEARPADWKPEVRDLSAFYRRRPR